MNYGNKTIVAEINELPWVNVIEEAVYARLRPFGYFFRNVKFCSWEHPLNRVPDCFAFMLDGFIQVNFKSVWAWRGDVCRAGYEVMEIRDTRWFDMGLTIGDCLTFPELLKAISVAEVKGKLVPEQE